MSTQLRDKDILKLGCKITDLAHQKEKLALARSRTANLSRNKETNLFDPKRDYIMGSSPIENSVYMRVINKRSKIKGGLHHLTYVVKARCRMKKLHLSMGDARKEAWRMMLITSQHNTPPRFGKNQRTEMIQGVQVVKFRVSEGTMDALFGASILPVLNPKDILSQKLMRQAHTVKKYDFHPIHRTIESSRTALSSGTFGVWVPGATDYLKMLTFTCAVCNAYRNWSYEAPLGSKYTRLKNQMGPFKEISIDPLGAITTKPFPGSRKTVKTFPLLIKCINSAAIQVILMESMETKAVIMALLRWKRAMATSKESPVIAAPTC